MESGNEDSLQKLALKAKKKLNRLSEEERKSKREIEASYVFTESTRKEDRKILEKKVKQLLKSSPDCLNPIGKLIDHEVYDKLDESQRQAYILKLAEGYREICESI